MRLGTETGCIVNHFMTTSISKVPNVGDGATLCYWSDRYPATVISVERKGKSVIATVQEDRATRIDANGISESQTYEYSRNEDGSKTIFRSRNDGASWEKVRVNENGRLVKSPDCGVYFGSREKFHDFTF